MTIYAIVRTADRFVFQCRSVRLIRTSAEFRKEKIMSTDKKIPLLVIVGATASGKTSLGIGMAKIFDGEVISADSMQIYKGMGIATAQPTVDEMQGVPHHLIDFLDVTESFSVAKYVELAGECIREVHSRGKLPIIVGARVFM